MGLWSEVKAAVDRIAGTSARVGLEFDPPAALPGDTVNVRITVINGEHALEARALLLELRGRETISIPHYVDAIGEASDRLAHRPTRAPIAVSASTDTFSALVRVEGAFRLAPGETRRFVGRFRVPPGAQPTFVGQAARHEWVVRARLDVFGADPDSGYLALRVGARA